jgi:hypothetical protein
MPLALATVALVGLVLVVAVALVAARLVSGSAGSGPPATPRASAALAAAATGVPPATLTAVGAPGPPTVTAPDILSTSTTQRADGLPAVIYVGAEFCPFCAAERWPLVVALSRFGRFDDLGVAVSSDQLVFPRTASVSFRGSSYRSRWIRFEATETYSASGTEQDPTSFAVLSTVPRPIAAVARRLDGPPLAPVAGTLPFVDLAGRAVVVGASFSPSVLAGLSAATIATDLAQPTNPVAEAIDGAANELTAVLCEATGGKPGSVCRSAAARAGAARLGVRFPGS